MIDCWRNSLRILKGSTGTGVADTPSGRAQVDTGQEGGEFGGGHLDADGPGVRDKEGSSFKSRGQNHHAISGPIKDLDEITTLVDEAPEMAGEGVESQVTR